MVRERKRMPGTEHYSELKLLDRQREGSFGRGAHAGGRRKLPQQKSAFVNQESERKGEKEIVRSERRGSWERGTSIIGEGLLREVRGKRKADSLGLPSREIGSGGISGRRPRTGEKKFLLSADKPGSIRRYSGVLGGVWLGFLGAFPTLNGGGREHL